MKFKLIIDKSQEEAVVATVHDRSRLTDEIESLVLQYTGTDRVAAYTEDGMRMLPFSDMECITVLDGKTYAITHNGERFRLKLRLYELETMLPASFIRINKSALANEAHLERFTASFNGAVDAVFQCGYREYVSRRCFAEIKRRYDKL
ncbi:MAG: LytTR family DNA-binding domain-containing protein [Faecousia sp.]